MERLRRAEVCLPGPCAIPMGETHAQTSGLARLGKRHQKGNAKAVSCSKGRNIEGSVPAFNEAITRGIDIAI